MRRAGLRPRLTRIDAAAAVLVNGFGYVAVPVGGRRRGGFLPVQDVVTGLAVRALLVSAAITRGRRET